MNQEQIKAAREALDSLDDYARMNTGVDAIGPRGVLERFISEVERTTSPDRKSCCAHDSDCAVHNAPALPVGPCDCSLANAEPQAQAEPVAFDADDLPRYDVQDGRMAREMDGRFVKLSDVRAAMKGKP